MLRPRRDGAAFATLLTIGRQNLHLREHKIAALGDEFAIDLTSAATPLGVYADGFLHEALGAERVDSIDASPYEGATIVHDLNQPVGPEFHAAY
jgi:hypothetical protein